MLSHLLEKVRDSGSESDWERLVTSERPRLVLLARRVLHDASLAEDCVQNVLLRLPSVVDQAELIAEGQARRWLSRAVVNAAVSIQRNERSRLLVQGEAARRREQLGDDLRARASALGLVRDALERLGPGLQKLLEDRYLRGRSYADLASDLGIAEVAVRKRVARAVKLLRGRLAQRGVGLLALLFVFARLQAAELATSIQRRTSASIRWSAIAALALVAMAGWVIQRTGVMTAAVPTPGAVSSLGHQDAISDLPVGAAGSADATDLPSDLKDESMRFAIPALLAAAAAVPAADTTPPTISGNATGMLTWLLGPMFSVSVTPSDPSGIRSVTVTVKGRTYIPQAGKAAGGKVSYNIAAPLFPLAGASYFWATDYQDPQYLIWTNRRSGTIQPIPYEIKVTDNAGNVKSFRGDWRSQYDSDVLR